MVKLTETKLPWTGPSLRVKVASGAVVVAEAASVAEAVAEVAEVDLEAEAGEALEGEAASEEAGEEEETTSHKERRRSLNSPVLSVPVLLERKDSGVFLCYLLMTEPSEDIPRQLRPVVCWERVAMTFQEIDPIYPVGFDWRFINFLRDE